MWCAYDIQAFECRGAEVYPSAVYWSVAVLALQRQPPHLLAEFAYWFAERPASPPLDRRQAILPDLKPVAHMRRVLN